MKTLNILVLLLSVNFYSHSQQSFLYNKKGQLLLDTTLTITKAQLRTWVMAENNIVAGLSRIEIPPLFLEGVFRAKTEKKIFIVSFVCDSFDIKNVEVLNDTSWGWVAKSVINDIQKQGKGIAGHLKSRSRMTSEQIYMGRYYVAINFVMVNFDELLKNDKAVPIIKGTIPLVETIMH